MRAPVSFVVAFAIVVSTLVTSSAYAQVDPQPERVVRQYHVVAARLNPLGLIYNGRLTGRFRLFDSDSDIAKQNFIGLGATGAITPAWARAGVMLEFQPLTILRLYASYEVMGYYGNFDYIASLRSASQDLGPDAIETRAADPSTENYASGGSWLTLGANLQLKVGPLVVRSLFRAVHASFDLRDDDRVFYEPIFDLTVPNKGWFISNDVDVLVLFEISDYSFAVGARWTYSAPLYGDEHFVDEADRLNSPRNDIHRVGLLAAWTFWKRPGTMFDRPTLSVLCQWHLHHRYRAGQEVSQGAPYFGIAFSVRGDVHNPGR